MKKISLTVFIFFFSELAIAKSKKFSKVMYYQNMYGQLHKLPSSNSATLSTVECAHPFKVFKKQEVSGWHKVATGPYEGFVKSQFLVAKKPTCFQDKYPKFFEKLGLEISDMYHWGKLYDHYLQGKSKAY